MGQDDVLKFGTITCQAYDLSAPIMFFNTRQPHGTVIQRRSQDLTGRLTQSNDVLLAQYHPPEGSEQAFMMRFFVYLTLIRRH
jgi:hypothetical protein